MTQDIPLVDVARGIAQDGQLDGAGFPLVTSFLTAEKSKLSMAQIYSEEKSKENTLWWTSNDSK